MGMRPTVLIVDDDEDLRETVCAILEVSGYRAIPASHGRAALDQLASGPLPDLILLDLMMPEMDGWQFRSVQKADPRLAHIPVVVLTASRNLEKFPIEAEAVLFKPFGSTELIKTVSRHCSSAAG
jgi:CheY-like chemotaxis protein